MGTLDLSCIDRDDRAFVQQRLLPFPDVIQRLLLKEYLSYPTKFERNTYLRATVEAIAAKLSLPIDKITLNVSEEDLRANAERYAKEVLERRRRFRNDERAL
ncbi:TPA: replication endonuclease, partial [Vibrio vulnificus]|nr:replication endonuclease [Vibrio vulnificus]HDY7608281.1 replication endonuclease [Vibrio vulnificus]